MLGREGGKNLVGAASRFYLTLTKCGVTPNSLCSIFALAYAKERRFSAPFTIKCTENAVFLRGLRCCAAAISYSLHHSFTSVIMAIDVPGKIFNFLNTSRLYGLIFIDILNFFVVSSYLKEVTWAVAAIRYNIKVHLLDWMSINPISCLALPPYGLLGTSVERHE